MQPTEQPERLPCVDALRGLMALCVAAYHFSSLSHAFGSGSPVASAIALLGIYSVQGFFIVSGLCFFHSYRDQIFGPREAQRFYVRRFFRIAPLYYAVLLTNLALGQAVWPRFSWGRIAENVTLSFGLFHPNHAMVLGGWSIGVEWVFYLAFPLLLWICRRNLGLWLSLLALTALPFLLEDSLRNAPEAARFHAYVRVANHAFLFLFGALCARIVARVRWRMPAVWLLALAALAFCVGASLLPPVYDHFALMYGATRAWGVAACTVLALLAAFGRVTRQGAFAPFRLLGDWSYAVYLLHPFAWQLVATLPSAGLSPKPRFCAAIALSLALAAVVHALFERPLLAWGKRLSDRIGAQHASHPFWAWSRVRALLLGLLLCLQCAAGAPTLCPDGHATTCNAPCPDWSDAG